jgi:hypothetical protein
MRGSSDAAFLATLKRSSSVANFSFSEISVASFSFDVLSFETVRRLGASEDFCGSAADCDWVDVPPEDFLEPLPVGASLPRMDVFELEEFPEEDAPEGCSAA